MLKYASLLPSGVKFCGFYPFKFSNELDLIEILWWSLSRPISIHNGFFWIFKIVLKSLAVSASLFFLGVSLNVLFSISFLSSDSTHTPYRGDKQRVSALHRGCLWRRVNILHWLAQYYSMAAIMYSYDPASKNRNIKHTKVLNPMVK